MQTIDKLLAEIDSYVDRVHHLVDDDFNRLVRLCKNGDLKSQMDDVFGELVHELQYYEIIRQKLEHIKLVHAWIARDHTQVGGTDTNEVQQNRNFFRLNYFQIQLLYFDYLFAIRKIQNFFNRHFGWNAAGFYEPTFLFGNCAEISKEVRVLNGLLLAAEKQFAGNMSVHIDGKLDHLNKLYSMACERWVLEVYMDKPELEDDFFKKAKEQALDDGLIDLF